jgi:multisubunit Na+/H+ antiporter MnhC subunit
LNTRLVIGIVLILLGVLVLINSAFLQVIVGIALIILGLWLALQNAPRGNI